MPSPIFDNSAIDGISAAAEDVFAVFRIPAPPAPMIHPCHVLN
jgi:molybdopterin biosynthesis enzyme